MLPLAQLVADSGVSWSDVHKAACLTARKHEWARWSAQKNNKSPRLQPITAGSILWAIGWRDLQWPFELVETPYSDMPAFIRLNMKGLLDTIPLSLYTISRRSGLSMKQVRTIADTASREGPARSWNMDALGSIMAVAGFIPPVPFILKINYAST